MQAIQNFFLDIKSSFWGPSFYTSIRKLPFFKVALFMFLVSLLLSVGIVGSFLIMAVPFLEELKNTDYVAMHYPEGLIVSITDGTASTNVEEPFFIPIPEVDKTEDMPFDHYLVIDTRPDATVEEISGYNAMAILTADRLLFEDGTDGRILPLKTMENVEITEEKAKEWAGVLMGILSVILIPLALMLLLMIPIFITISHLVASSVGALAVMLIGMIRTVKLSYGEAYKTALVASVPIIIIQTVAYFFGLLTLPFFIDFLIFLAIVAANLENDTPIQEA